MPWTLYRHILKDLLKLLCLSLGILVIVIAVGVAIKPITKGHLGPWTLIKFVFLSAPTILDMALPFAAAFAGTLVFHRMMSDNEITACRASGMSFRVIFAPVFFLGIILSGGMFLLSNWAIPRFSKLASESIRSDAVRLVVSTLREDHTFHQRSHVLYADEVEEVPLQAGDMGTESSDVKPLRLVMLKGVAMGQLDDDGRLRQDSTAERADLLMYHKNGKSWVTVRLKNAMHYSSSPTSPWGHAAQAEYKLEIPNPFKNKLRFHTASQLRQLKKEPERSASIKRLKVALCTQLARDRVLTQFEETIRKPRGANEISLLGITDQHVYLIKAAHARRIGDTLQLQGSPSQPVQVDFFLQGKPVTRTTSNAGLLQIQFDHDLMNLSLQLDASTVMDMRHVGRTTQHAKPPAISPLRWHDPIMTSLTSKSVFELSKQVRQTYPQQSPLRNTVRAIHSEMAHLGRKIQALHHHRAAAAMGVLLVLLISVAMPVYLKGKMPLVVYFWSFSLTSAAVMATRSCDNILVNRHYPTSVGVLAIWSGNLMLLVAATLLGWKLSRPRV